MKSIRAPYCKDVIYFNNIIVAGLSVFILVNLTVNRRFIAPKNLLGSIANFHSNVFSTRPLFTISKCL